MINFGGFGSEERTSYFFLTDQGIIVRCGCFVGKIDKFRQKVKETHGNNHYAESYLKIADFAEWELGEWGV